MNGEVLEKQLYDIATQFCKEKMPIKGKVYYRGLRPIQKNISSYKEDVVIAFLIGSGTDIQEGTCLLNVYTPDTQTNSGVYYANKTRCAEIASILEHFPAFANKLGAIYFLQDGMIQTIEEDSIKQHFISLKMKFKVLNDNY